MRPTLALAALLLGGVLARGVQAASLEVSPVIDDARPRADRHDDRDRQSRRHAHCHLGAHLSLDPDRWRRCPDTDCGNYCFAADLHAARRRNAALLRLLLRGGSAAAGERTYRLVLDEVPPAAATNRQVTFALRQSLPVFMDASPSVRPALQWRAARGAGGETTLTATNASPAYDKITALEVALADGSHPKVVSHSTSLYVLSGDAHRWTVQTRGPGPGGPLRVSVTTMNGKSELTLTP